MEGSFWFLWVEFKFYFIFGTFYFCFGSKKAIFGIFSLYLLYLFGNKLNISLLNNYSELFSFMHFGWFASGSLCYIYHTSKNLKYLLLSFLPIMIQIYQFINDSNKLIFSFFIVLIFFTPIYFEKTRKLLSNKLLLFLGLISYPLYLIHENAMISLICKTAKIIEMPFLLLPIIPILLLIFISYLIIKKIEPFIQKNIKYGINILFKNNIINNLLKK